MLKKQASLLFYLLLMVGCIIFILKKAATNNQNLRGTEIRAVKGVFDFSNEKFDDQKLFPLRGEVQFYWYSLLSPGDFNDSIITNFYLVNIPSIWNNYNLNGFKPRGEGFATYRFSIFVPDNQVYGFSIKELETSYKIWANDQYAETGTVADNKSDIVPCWKPLQLFVKPQNNLINITIQIANFNHRKGGLEQVIQFGSAKSIISNKIQADATEYVILGILIFSFLYYFGLFLFDFEDKASLFFSLLNLSIVFRLISTGEKLILTIFPDISWLSAIRIEYLNIAFPTTLSLFLIHEIYPSYLPKWILKIKLVILTLFSSIVLFFPSGIFTYMTLIYQPIILLSILLVGYVLLRALINKDRHAPFLIAGLLVFILLAINDILYYDNILHSGYLLPYGAIILVFSFSYALSGRYTQALSDTAHMKNELEKYSQHLEEEVEIRTSEIIEQKRLLEIQTQELSVANTKLRELMEYRDMMTSMIIHDMKTPLTAITNLADDSDIEFIRLARQSGNQLYNLIQNLLELQRYDEARLEITNISASFDQILISAFDQVSYFFELKKITFVNKAEPNQTIYCDPFLVERIMVNLLFNALKFTPEKGQIIVECSAVNKAKIITVTDTGCGIEKEFHTKIFNRYVQVTRNFNQKASTGLGLAFCKIAVEAHGGSIGVNSEVGKGSIFWFNLPDPTV